MGFFGNSGVAIFFKSNAFLGEGFLYTFGEGDNGKLGIPGDTTSRNTPQKLDLDSQFLDVKCGGNHTLALTGKKRPIYFPYKKNS